MRLHSATARLVGNVVNASVPPLKAHTATSQLIDNLLKIESPHDYEWALRKNFARLRSNDLQSFYNFRSALSMVFTKFYKKPGCCFCAVPTRRLVAHGLISWKTRLPKNGGRERSFRGSMSTITVFGGPVLCSALRHSYTTLLRQNGNDPKIVQGLLRHSSIKITMDIYDEAVSDEKQRAHRGVIRQVTRRDRSVIRSAPVLAVPQVPDFVGVPDGI